MNFIAHGIWPYPLKKKIRDDPFIQQLKPGHQIRHGQFNCRVDAVANGALVVTASELLDRFNNVIEVRERCQICGDYFWRPSSSPAGLCDSCQRPGDLHFCNNGRPAVWRSFIDYHGSLSECDFEHDENA